MNIAAIDVGTNSVKLLVARYERDHLTPVLERGVITRLGEGLGAGKKISIEAADRTLEALAEFKRLADRHEVQRLGAVGTRALRAASNARDFLLRCEYEAGFKIRVITEEEEAKFAFRGAISGSPRDRALVLDIGGGSAQLSAGDRRRVEWYESLPLGAVVLTERHLRSDPPSAEEMESLRKVVRRRLAKSLEVRWSWDRAEFVGVGGTVTTIAAIGAGRVHRAKISLEAIRAAVDKLAAMPLSKRRRVRGLDPKRADIIVAGGTVLVETMAALGAPVLRVSTHGLRHGLALELAR